MFSHKVAFVVGAGASCDYGFGAGHALKQLITASLRNGDDSTVHDLSQNINSCLVQLSQHPMHSDIQSAADKMASSLSLFSSIDHYAYSNQSDQSAVLCAKVAIAACILNYENKSSLNFEYSELISRRENVPDGYLTPLFSKLMEMTNRDNLEQTLQNIVFISFNYDRCIEQFFYNAFRIALHMDEKEAADYLSHLKVIHPYGSLGRLAWQKNSFSSALDFGADMNVSNTIQSANEIRTFTESVDAGTVAQVKAEIESSCKCVFLGFGFHPQNVELIRPVGPTHCEFYYSTTYKVSPYVYPKWVEQVRAFNSIPGSKSVRDIQFIPGASAKSLLEENGALISMF